MKTTFTDLVWRSDDDKAVIDKQFGDILSICLDGGENGVVTINGQHNTYTAPYCELTLGGGIIHYECCVPNPHNLDEYYDLIIFVDSGKVCLNYRSYGASEWFKNKCKNFIG